MDAPPYFWPCLQRETASCLLHISRESKIILSPEKLVYKPIKKKTTENNRAHLAFCKFNKIIEFVLSTLVKLH